MKEDNTIAEIKDIMDLLGRGYQDGYVKGTHLAQILTYLRQINEEKMKLTLAKLALVCGMTQRNLRENYLSGLEAFGIIKIRVVGTEMIWKWIGKKAFDNGNILPDVNILTAEKTKEDE